MNKSKLNYWIDFGLAITFLLCFVTGIIKFPILFQYVRTLPLKEISFIHDWSGILMSILVFIHLILHWDWIKAMTKQIFSKNKSR
jgi:cytochrome b subunit of formate dehydrogenase